MFSGLSYFWWEFTCHLFIFPLKLCGFFLSAFKILVFISLFKSVIMICLVVTFEIDPTWGSLFLEFVSWYHLPVLESSRLWPQQILLSPIQIPFPSGTPVVHVGLSQRSQVYCYWLSDHSFFPLCLILDTFCWSVSKFNNSCIYCIRYAINIWYHSFYL